MIIVAEILRRNEEKKIKMAEGSTIYDLLNKIDISPDQVVTIEDERVVPVDSELKDGQKLKLMEVNSGG